MSLVAHAGSDSPTSLSVLAYLFINGMTYVECVASLASLTNILSLRYLIIINSLYTLLSILLA